jgi:hypothetical protein
MAEKDTGAITPAQIETAGPDAVSLMLNLMQRNSRETAAIQQTLIASLQHDFDDALQQIGRIRRNVLTVLHRPHTDYDIEVALYASYDIGDQAGML